MQDPKAYHQANSMQTTDVELILKQYPIAWKAENARILDIGCGDGSVTMNIWKKYFPDNFMKLVGSDKSQECVEFAREHYESEKVEFIKLDIEEEVPNELKRSFDHVISSYTLQWVHRQQSLDQNTMQDPKAYHQANSMQTTDVELILKQYPIAWKAENARILDIGCGDGSVTMNIWKKYFPDNFMKLVGSDKSQECVEFAREHYESEKVEFIKLDIEEEVPNELKRSFDHVISSYTLQWVHRQQTGFSNIFDMLADGGSCLLIFLGHVDVYDYYRQLSRTSKWSADLANVETKFMSPYQDCQDPGQKISSLLKKIGFRDINVKVLQKTFDFVRGVDEFRTMMKSFNPFEGLKEKWDEFMDDYAKLQPNAGTMVYQLLVVYGAK